jgi:hypothetical protein
MILYIIPFIVVFFAAIVFDICKYPDNGSRFFIWIGLYIYLLSLIGLRYMVGGDSYTYMLYFNSLSPTGLFDISWDSDFQPLFVLLVNLTKLIYPSFISFQIVHAFIITTALFYYMAKNSQFRFTTLFLCLFMFYINFTVEILRESLAIMVFIYNYKNLENNKWAKYYIGVLIAIMFHLSAVFLIFLPFLKFLRLNKTYIVLLVIAFFALTQLNFVFTFFENFEKINKKVSDYSKISYGWKSTVLFFTTRTLIPIGLFFWGKVKFDISIKYESLICVFGLLGVCSIFNTIIFTRFTNYIMLFYCIALAEFIIPFLRKKVMTLSNLFVTLMFIVIVLTSGYTSFNWPPGYYEKWIPYYSIFSSESESNKFIDRNY